MGRVTPSCSHAHTPGGKEKKYIVGIPVIHSVTLCFLFRCILHITVHQTENTVGVTEFSDIKCIKQKMQ